MDDPLKAFLMFWGILSVLMVNLIVIANGGILAVLFEIVVVVYIYIDYNRHKK